MPEHARLQPPRPQRRPPFPELEYRPPYPWPGSATPPEIVDMQTFADVHRWADIKMVNYIVRPQANYAVAPSLTARITLACDAAFTLSANNAEARIAFAEITLNHLLADPDVKLGPGCFVTIAPAVCALPVGDAIRGSRDFRAARREDGSAAAFDVRQIQQFAREGMGKVPFVGMVEAALYRHWGPEGRSWEDYVSWHCHLLAWGATQSELSRHLKPLRNRHQSIRQGVASVHVQDCHGGDIARQFAYAMKAPQKLYRVECYKRPWTNPRTGEIRKPGWHTQKEWLQTGHRIRLLDVMGERTLDQLLFGNRNGTTLVRAIRDEALAPFRTWEARQPWVGRA